MRLREAISLIACDLDGTLLKPGGELGAYTARVVRSLTRRGVRVILASGRSPTSVASYASLLGLDGPHVALNGAAIVAGGRVVSGQRLSLDALATAAEVLRAYGLVPFYFGESTCGYAAEHAEHVRHVEGWGFDIFRAVEAPDEEPILHLHAVGEAPAAAGAARDINARLSGVASAWAYPSWRGELWHLDVASAGVDKGGGLAEVAARVGVPLSRALACGDWLNDLPMFKAAGCAVAMSHAGEEIRAAAAYVTRAPYTEEGLAAFLEELFGLGEEP
jgi:hypothetical protein